VGNLKTFLIFKARLANQAYFVKFLQNFCTLNSRETPFLFSKTITIPVPYSECESLKNTNIGQVSLAGEESTKQQYSNLTDRVNDMVEAVKHAIVLLQIAKVGSFMPCG
jgi:hypothetical protein